MATVKRIGPEAVTVSQALGDRWSEHFAHHFLGDCAVIEGDVAEAERRYRLSLEAAWETGDQVETCYELQGMAMAAAGSGDAVRALRLASAASANIKKLGVEASALSSEGRCGRSQRGREDPAWLPPSWQTTFRSQFFPYGALYRLKGCSCYRP